MPPLPPLQFSGSSGATSGGDFVGGSIVFNQREKNSGTDSLLLGAAVVAAGLFLVYKMVK